MKTKKEISSTFAIGMLCTLLGAVLFSGKAVLVKLIYREQPITVVSLLALRMLFSLPFYVAMFFYAVNKMSEEEKSNILSTHNGKHLLPKIVIVGSLGYYVSSFLDFVGLQYISAGLERIILFMYPTFTLLFGRIFF